MNVNHPRRLCWAIGSLDVERRRRDCENAFLNADDYVVDAQVVLQRRAATGQVQSKMWTCLVGRCRRQRKIVNSNDVESGDGEAGEKGVDIDRTRE
jgi:hypothetical protein